MTPKAMLADLRRWNVSTETVSMNLGCSRSTVLKLGRLDSPNGISPDFIARLERLWKRYKAVSGAREAHR